MNREDARAEWKRATTGLGAANTLAISGYNNDAVSRAYYAILHAAKAGLATKGIDAGSHRGVAAMFGKEFVKTGQMEAQEGRKPQTSGRGAAERRLPGTDGVQRRRGVQGV